MSKPRHGEINSPKSHRGPARHRGARITAAAISLLLGLFLFAIGAGTANASSNLPKPKAHTTAAAITSGKTGTQQPSVKATVKDSANPQYSSGGPVVCASAVPGETNHYRQATITASTTSGHGFDPNTAEVYEIHDWNGVLMGTYSFTTDANGEFNWTTTITAAEGTYFLPGNDVQYFAYVDNVGTFPTITDPGCNTNHNPVANDDTATTDENSSVTVHVLANDSDQDKDALIVTSATNPAHGTAVVSGGGQTVTYTPSNGYYGADSFTYSISDGHGGTASAKATITVNPSVIPCTTASPSGFNYHYDNKGGLLVSPKDDVCSQALIWQLYQVKDTWDGNGFNATSAPQYRVDQDTETVQGTVAQNFSVDLSQLVSQAKPGYEPYEKDGQCYVNGQLDLQNAPGQTEVTAAGSSAPLYYYVGPFRMQVDSSNCAPVSQTVTPSKPVPSGYDCTHKNDIIQVPTTEGVAYMVGDQDVSGQQLVLKPGESVSIQPVAKDGYKLDKQYPPYVFSNQLDTSKCTVTPGKTIISVNVSSIVLICGPLATEQYSVGGDLSKVTLVVTVAGHQVKLTSAHVFSANRGQTWSVVATVKDSSKYEFSNGKATASFSETSHAQPFACPGTPTGSSGTPLLPGAAPTDGIGVTTGSPAVSRLFEAAGFALILVACIFGFARREQEA